MRILVIYVFLNIMELSVLQIHPPIRVVSRLAVEAPTPLSLGAKFGNLLQIGRGKT